MQAPRPKPTDNFPPGSRITPHMLNAAFSSAPNITLDMIAAKSRAGAALRAEDSMMSDAALDSAMTTATSIGGVLNNLVDHSESARLENAPQNPFRDTMDSINSQVRPPRLGGNELFNSHLRSFRETLAMAGRPPPSSSSTGQPPSSDKESHREKYQPLAPGSIGGSSGQVALDSVAPPNRTMPMQPRSTDGRECSSVSSVTQAHAGAGPVRKLDMHTIHRASDHSEHRSEVRSRHPTPPHAALRSSTRGPFPFLVFPPISADFTTFMHVCMHAVLNNSCICMHAYVIRAHDTFKARYRIRAPVRQTHLMSHILSFP